MIDRARGWWCFAQNPGNATEKKVILFLKKGRFLVPNSKKLSFSDYYVSKTHKHLKWVLKSILFRPKIRFEKGRFRVKTQKGWLLVTITAIRHTISPFFLCYKKYRRNTVIFSVGKTFPIKKRINIEVFIGRTAANYIEGMVVINKNSANETSWLEGLVYQGLKRCGKESSGGSPSQNEFYGNVNRLKFPGLFFRSLYYSLLRALALPQSFQPCDC